MDKLCTNCVAFRFHTVKAMHHRLTGALPKMFYYARIKTHTEFKRDNITDINWCEKFKPVKSDEPLT